jgi:hypothetical protein
MNRLLLIAAVLLMSCTHELPKPTFGQVEPGHSLPERMEPGYYANYRTVVTSWYWSNLHDPALAECIGAFTVANVPPADLALLDRYARGEIAMPKQDFERIDGALSAKMNAAPSTREALRPYCPDKVDGFNVPD